MSSRKQQKEMRQRERQEAERHAEERRRRLRRWRIYGGASALTSALAVAAAIIVLSQDADDPTKVFSAKPDGLAERIQKARLTLGPDHFHPIVRVVANGQDIPIPDDIGAGKDGQHAPLHRHPGDEQLHAEGLKEGRFTLAQLMQVWGVPLSATRLGPYTADAGRKVAVFAKPQGRKRFSEVRDIDGLRLDDGDEVYVTYGTAETLPIAQ